MPPADIHPCPLACPAANPQPARPSRPAHNVSTPSSPQCAGLAIDCALHAVLALTLAEMSRRRPQRWAAQRVPLLAACTWNGVRLLFRLGKAVGECENGRESSWVHARELGACTEGGWVLAHEHAMRMRRLVDMAHAHSARAAHGVMQRT